MPNFATPTTYRARPATPQPLYAQVRDLLLNRVRGGEWSAGENLPNEFVLSTDFDVSIGTVRRAVAELEANGVLVRKQGRRTYVSGRGAEALQERFFALRATDGQRFVAVYVLVSLTRRAATPTERAALRVAEQHGVVEIVQRLDVGGGPVGLETSVVPAEQFPRLDTQLRFGQHLYPVLADYGFLITRVEDTIGVEHASFETAAHFGCATDAPLLLVTRLAVALDGRPVEVRTSRYLPERVRYVGSASPAPALV